MRFFNFYTLTSLIIFFSLTNAYGFTIKSGQVLSSDGKVYDFASPAEQQKLMEKYEAGGDQVGVFNKNLFIMQDDGIIAVPMGKITGIGKDELNEVINDAFKEYEVKTVKKYVEMPPEDIAKMDAEKLAKVPPKAMAQMGEGQIKAIKPEAMAKFKPEQMGALPPQVIQHFRPEHFAVLPPEVFGEMKVDMLNAIDPKAFENINPDQMQKLLSHNLCQGRNLYHLYQVEAQIFKCLN